MAERKKVPYAVIAASRLSDDERAYAIRMGILREPKWQTSNHTPDIVNKAESDGHERYDLSDPNVLPAGNIRSGWGRNVESKTGIVRRMR